MTFEFQKLLESYESGNRMFHTISELFYAIPFIVFGSIIWYMRIKETPNRNENEFQFTRFNNSIQNRSIN